MTEAQKIFQGYPAGCHGAGYGREMGEALARAVTYAGGAVPPDVALQVREMLDRLIAI